MHTYLVDYDKYLFSMQQYEAVVNRYWLHL